MAKYLKTTALFLVLPTMVVGQTSQDNTKPARLSAADMPMKSVADGPPRPLFHFDMSEKPKPFVLPRNPKRKGP